MFYESMKNLGTTFEKNQQVICIDYFVQLNCAVGLRNKSGWIVLKPVLKKPEKQHANVILLVSIQKYKAGRPTMKKYSALLTQLFF